MNCQTAPAPNQHRTKGRRFLVEFWLFCSVFLLCPIVSLAVDDPENPRQRDRAMRMASQSVDKAWAAFHLAALGGTLASPAIQTQIEDNLHEARTLLLHIRQSYRRSDFKQVDQNLVQLNTLTQEAIRLSQERKP